MRRTCSRRAARVASAGTRPPIGGSSSSADLRRRPLLPQQQAPVLSMSCFAPRPGTSLLHPSLHSVPCYINTDQPLALLPQPPQLFLPLHQHCLPPPIPPRSLRHRAALAAHASSSASAMERPAQSLLPRAHTPNNFAKKTAYENVSERNLAFNLHPASTLFSPRSINEAYRCPHVPRTANSGQPQQQPRPCQARSFDSAVVALLQ